MSRQSLIFDPEKTGLGGKSTRQPLETIREIGGQIICETTLDEYINLKERVENRIVIADVTATGDDNVLTSKSSDIAFRKEQLRRMQEEVVELEDVKAGISITDLGLNEFRMDLLNYVNPTSATRLRIRLI